MFHTKATSYAVLALVEAARASTQSEKKYGVQAGKLAKKFKLPPAYAAKILGQVAQAGILASSRGPQGGFRLVRPPEKITLDQVIDAVAGLDEAKAIGGPKPLPKPVRDGLNLIFHIATEQTRTMLRAITVADLLQPSPTRSIRKALRA